MSVEKLPTAGNPALDPSTNSVRITNGQIAAEGQQAGQAANQQLQNGLDIQFNDRRPGNSPYWPK